MRAHTKSLQPQYAGFKLIVGMDANAYTHAKPKKQLAVQELQDALVSHKLQCNWPSDITKWPMTTMNARTFLQPQLNKASIPIILTPCPYDPITFLQPQLNKASKRKRMITSRGLGSKCPQNS